MKRFEISMTAAVVALLASAVGLIGWGSPAAALPASGSVPGNTTTGAGVGVVVAAGPWEAPALGRGRASVNLRRDPDDASGGLDIRTVGTAQNGHKVLLKVRTYDAFDRHDVDLSSHDSFDFVLDTRADHASDRVVSMGYAHANGGRFVCRVHYPNGNYRHRRAHRTADHDLRCSLPLRWFAIEKTVRFSVTSYFGNPVDRAPDKHRYVGL